MVEREWEHYKIYWWTWRIFECVYLKEKKWNKNTATEEKGFDKYALKVWINEARCDGLLSVLYVCTKERKNVFIEEIVKNLWFNIELGDAKKILLVTSQQKKSQFSNKPS